MCSVLDARNANGTRIESYTLETWHPVGEIRHLEITVMPQDCDKNCN